MTKQNKIILLALLTALGSILFIIENFVQLPILWFRLGLANMMTLLALKWWGLKEGMSVLLLRVLIGSLLSGRFLSPLFVMAIGGGITSTILMWSLFHVKNDFFGLIGISILGALAKNITQIFIAYVTYINQIELFRVIPFLIITSLVTGFIIGFLTILFDSRLNKSFQIHLF